MPLPAPSVVADSLHVEQSESPPISMTALPSNSVMSEHDEYAVETTSGRINVHQRQEIDLCEIGSWALSTPSSSLLEEVDAGELLAFYTNNPVLTRLRFPFIDRSCGQWRVPFLTSRDDRDRYAVRR